MPDELIVNPGVYQKGGASFRLDSEGLVRIVSPDYSTRQLLVSGPEVMALLSGICWLFSHGSRDNELPFARLLEKARGEKLIVTCGTAASFTVSLLAVLGVPARVVMGRTLGEPDSCNDGHVLTEVWMHGRWSAFDPDRACCYLAGNRRLNIQEMVCHLSCSQLTREVLAAPTPVAPGFFASQGIDLTPWHETLFAQPDGGEEFLRRTLNIPVITQGGKNFFTTSSQSERARAEVLWSARDGLIFLPPEEFQKTFYQSPPDFP